MRKPPTRLKKTIGWLLSAFLLVVYFSPQAQLLRTLPARLSVAVGQQAVLDAPREGGAEMDAERVMQVFDNLLSNAARFAQSRVEASLAWNGSTLVLSVRDDGPGFTPEGLRRGAEPFYRGDGPDNQGHLGLGLNICRVLCEACGGGLEIANAREGGARVRAWFGA